MVNRKSWIAIGSIVLGSMVAFACTVEDKNDDGDSGDLFGGVGGYQPSAGGRAATISSAKSSTAKGGGRFSDIAGSSTGGRRSSSSSSAGAAGDSGGGSQGGSTGDATTLGGSTSSLGGAGSLGGGTASTGLTSVGGGTASTGLTSVGGASGVGGASASGGVTGVGGSSTGNTTVSLSCSTGCAALSLPVSRSKQMGEFGVRLEAATNFGEHSSVGVRIAAPGESSGRFRMFVRSATGFCASDWEDIVNVAYGFESAGGSINCELDGVTSVGIQLSSGEGTSYDSANSSIDVLVDSLSFYQGVYDREYRLETAPSVSGSATTDPDLFAPITGGGTAEWRGE